MKTNKKILSLVGLAAMMLAGCGETSDKPTEKVTDKPVVTETDNTAGQTSDTTAENPTTVNTEKPPVSSDSSVVDPDTSAPATDPVTSDSGSSESTSETHEPTVIDVSSVSLNKITLTLEIGDSDTLTATVLPENATDPTVTWFSNDEAVATVDQTGKVTAVSAGTATITAKAGAVEATCAVTVNEKAVLTAKIALYTMDGSETTTSYVENSGAYKAEVILENIPSGKTRSDYTYTWPDNSSNYAFGDYAPDVQGYQKFLTPVNAGSYSFTVQVKDGDTVVATPEVSFEVTADYSKYTIINTVDDFVSKVLKSTSGADKFALGANLDLGGINTDGATNNITFNGTFDGRGYTVKNFVANASSAGTNGGLWFNVSAAASIRNTHFIGTVNQPNGWGGLLCREMFGLVENCIFEATTASGPANNDWTWCRSGIVAGMLKGTIRNTVVMNNTTDSAIANQMLDTTAYAGAAADGAVLIENVYTANSSTEENQHVLPFRPTSETWCGEANTKNLHDSWNFSTAKASDYNLTNSYWVLEDGKNPALTHDADAFVKAEPKLAAKASATSLKVGGDNATVTLTTSNFSSEVAYSATASVDSIVTLTNNNDGTFTVAPAAEGETAVTFTATAGEESASASITFKVAASGAVTPTYEIPENATAIGTKEEFLSYFDGSAAHCNTNAYLTADIDLGGEAITGMKMAGDWAAVFEGCGHSVTNYTQTMPFFNIVTGTIRNVKFVSSGSNMSGFGAISYNNQGTMINVDSEVTITGAINNFGAIAMWATGKFEDCDVTIHVTADAATSNTLFYIARADSGSEFTNCTYFADGEGYNEAQFIASPATGLTKRDAA